MSTLLWNCCQTNELKLSPLSKFIPLVNAAAFAERVPRAVLDDCRNQFLPQLRELVTDRTCLGFWSRLFECHRPPLVELRAACSHIGIPSVNQFDWSHTPNLWPNMEILEFFNKSHSTLNALKSIAPHLGEFRKSQKSYHSDRYSDKWSWSCLVTFGFFGSDRPSTTDWTVCPHCKILHRKKLPLPPAGIRTSNSLTVPIPTFSLDIKIITLKWNTDLFFT